MESTLSSEFLPIFLVKREAQFQKNLSFLITKGIVFLLYLMLMLTVSDIPISAHITNLAVSSSFMLVSVIFRHSKHHIFNMYYFVAACAHPSLPIF